MPIYKGNTLIKNVGRADGDESLFVGNKLIYPAGLIYNTTSGFLSGYSVRCNVYQIIANRSNHYSCPCDMQFGTITDGIGDPLFGFRPVRTMNMRYTIQTKLRKDSGGTNAGVGCTVWTLNDETGLWDNPVWVTKQVKTVQQSSVSFDISGDIGTIGDDRLVVPSLDVATSDLYECDLIFKVKVV